MGPNRGHGALHIWAEHQREMAAVGLFEFGDVAAFAARVVRAGTPVFYGDHNWTVTRTMAVRARAGTAILELRTPRDVAHFWSIVTVFAAEKAHGTRVGAVR